MTRKSGQPAKRKKSAKKWEALASWGCAYCGCALTVDDMHLDHPIPDCLFTPPRPERIELPSCWDCNNKKSKYDSFLRDMTVLAKGAMANPVARQLKMTKVTSSIQQNKSEVMRQMTKSMDFANIREFRFIGGVLEFRDGVSGSLDMDGDYAKTAILWVIRGLYRGYFGKVFVVGTPIEITAIPKEYINFTKSTIASSFYNDHYYNIPELIIGNTFSINSII
jgi:hypothetical protein